jgi:2-iminobutanoate/2-iminopropanoate deaminase
MARTTFSSPDAPAAVGPYSQAVASGDHVFLSGQTPIDPATGALVEADVAGQTRQCFDNLDAVLAAAGLSFADVVKVNVYLTSMDDFAAMNAVYEGRFEQPYPARTTIGVAALPLGARIEIELVARRNA